MTLSNDNKEFVIKDGIWKKKTFSSYENAQNFFWQKKLLTRRPKKLKYLALHSIKMVRNLKKLNYVIKIASLEANDYP